VSNPLKNSTAIESNNKRNETERRRKKSKKAHTEEVFFNDLERDPFETFGHRPYFNIYKYV